MTNVLETCFTANFIITPKPRDLTEKEIDKFGLRYYGGKEIKPAYEDTGNVWITYDKGSLPTYRLYSCGTNCLLILKYLPEKDVWEEVQLSNVKALYSILWKIISKMEYTTNIVPELPTQYFK